MSTFEATLLAEGKAMAKPNPHMVLRRVILRPYRRGHGPTFTLTMHDTGRYDRRGQTYIGYVLRQSGPRGGRDSRTVFWGEDFAGSPLHADDSDATVRALMGFLTLQPGDTDADYFEAYTPEQRAFYEDHAEALSLECANRFGEG